MSKFNIKSDADGFLVGKGGKDVLQAIVDDTSKTLDLLEKGEKGGIKPVSVGAKKAQTVKVKVESKSQKVTNVTSVQKSKANRDSSGRFVSQKDKQEKRAEKSFQTKMIDNGAVQTATLKKVAKELKDAGLSKDGGGILGGGIGMLARTFMKGALLKGGLLAGVATAGIGLIAKNFLGEKFTASLSESISSSISSAMEKANAVKEVVVEKAAAAKEKWDNSTVGQFVNDSSAAAKNAIVGGNVVTKVTGGKSATTQDATALQSKLFSKGLVKSKEATGGGLAHAGAYALAEDVSVMMGKNLKYFSAFDDRRHRRTSPTSTHTKGLAFDIVNKSGSKKEADAQSRALYEKLTKQGFSGKLATIENGKKVMIGNGSDFFIQDEYNRPSKKSSGGHIHFNWGSKEVADKYFRMTRGGATVSQTENKGVVGAVKSAVSSVGGGIMSLIASKESVQKGKSNYDVGNRKDSSRKSGYSYYNGTLQDKTLGQVMDIQAKGQLYAAGKYQMIPSTLEEAMKGLNLSKDTLFNAETQEKMGVYLALKKRPDIAKYIRTGKGKDAAALAFAKEWASIPVLKGSKAGKSYYPRDKAHHSTATVNKYLDELPVLYKQAISKGMTQGQAYEYALTKGQAKSVIPTAPASVSVKSEKAKSSKPATQAIAPKGADGYSVPHMSTSRTVSNKKIAHISSGHIS